MNEIPSAAIYTGPPSREMIRFIQNETRTDSEGQRYFRDRNLSWRKLRTPADFKELNKILDRVREVEAANAA